MSKILIILGIFLVSVGVVLYYFPNTFGWFGRLPGDIRIERDNGAFYFPITTMILISIVLSLISFLLRK